MTTIEVNKVELVDDLSKNVPRVFAPVRDGEPATMLLNMDTNPEMVKDHEPGRDLLLIIERDQDKKPEFFANEEEFQKARARKSLEEKRSVFNEEIRKLQLKDQVENNAAVKAVIQNQISRYEEERDKIALDDDAIREERKILLQKELDQIISEINQAHKTRGEAQAAIEYHKKQITKSNSLTSVRHRMYETTNVYMPQEIKEIIHDTRILRQKERRMASQVSHAMERLSQEKERLDKIRSDIITIVPDEVHLAKERTKNIQDEATRQNAISDAIQRGQRLREVFLTRVEKQEEKVAEIEKQVADLQEKRQKLDKEATFAEERLDPLVKMDPYSPKTRGNSNSRTVTRMVVNEHTVFKRKEEIFRLEKEQHRTLERIKLLETSRDEKKTEISNLQ